jgi:hypothetical protein
MPFPFSTFYIPLARRALTWGNGQLQSTSTPEGLISYGYDCGSKLGSVTKGGESASYTYDGSLLLTDTRAGMVNQTIEYGYNADLQVADITYARQTDSFTYDNDGLLTGAGAYTITRNASNGLPESVSDTTLTQGFRDEPIAVLSLRFFGNSCVPIRHIIS